MVGSGTCWNWWRQQTAEIIEVEHKDRLVVDVAPSKLASVGGSDGTGRHQSQQGKIVVLQPGQQRNPNGNVPWKFANE